MEHVGEEKAELFDSREEVEEFFNFMDRDYDGNLSFEVFDNQILIGENFNYKICIL